MQALLKNKNITLRRGRGIADIKAGKIDPRRDRGDDQALGGPQDHRHVHVLGPLAAHRRRLGLEPLARPRARHRRRSTARSCGRTRPRRASSRPSSSELPEEYRPNEIGSPFAISGPGYFTDAAHQDHVHFGFKQEISKDWRPPADVAAGGAAPARRRGRRSAAPARRAVPAAPGAPAAAAAAAPAAPKVGDSGQFMAATADAAAEEGRLGQFMAVQPRRAGERAGRPRGRPGRGRRRRRGGAGRGAARLGASALKIAQGQLGVKEEGTNTGAEVDEYLEAAGVPPGNPWCASFVTWSLAQAGHKMDGSGWAAVQTWVRNAEAGKNDLQIVSADEARPGDIVAYDWGGQDDFGADGHIGFLAERGQGRQVHRAGGQQPGRGHERPAPDERRERQVHPHRRRRAARGARRRRGAPAAPAERRAASPTPPPRPPTSPASPATTRATTRPRRRSPRGWARRPRSAGSRSSCR